MLTLSLLVTTALAPQATEAHFDYLWGGETRQICTLDVGSSRHVWTVGDGPRIRHAINPTSSTTWEFQTVPDDVFQNLLDVHFIPGVVSDPAHIGFACGVNGNVLKTVDYGATWVHLNSSPVMNQDVTPQNATLWRNRFLSENDGFVAGLWTFKRWNGATGTWNGIRLADKDLSPGINYAGRVEFYALELIVDPSDATKWVGVAAGQLWSSVGAGGADTGIVFYGRSDFQGGNTWVETFRTVLPSGGLGGGPMNIDDPWDISFAAPNPTDIKQTTGYLCAGGNLSEFPDGAATGTGGVWRTTDSGRHWTLELPGTANEEVNTLYGITAIDADHAVAVGYGGQIWYRNGSAGWICRRGGGTTCLAANLTSDDRQGPLSGCQAAGTDVYVSGSWGYLETSPDFVGLGVKLNPASSDNKHEHWRFEDILVFNSGLGFAVGEFKTIAETSDSGANWAPSASSPGVLPPFPPPPPPPPSSAALVALASGGGIAVTVGAANFMSSVLLDRQFAFRSDTAGLPPVWTAGSSAPLQLKSLTLNDVAYSQGQGANSEFWAAGKAVDLNDVSQPALYRSIDGGVTWSDAAGGAIASDVVLKGIAFRGGVEGFAVGYNATGPVAYRINLIGGTSITQVTVASFGGTKLLGVAANDARVVAVGENAGVLYYASGQFITWQFPQPPPSLGFSVPPDYVSVAMPPGNDVRVLISAAQSAKEADSPGLGRVLYFNGTEWKVRPETSNKDIHGIYLRSDAGWAVAGHGANITSEVGTVGDIMVLHFDPD